MAIDKVDAAIERLKLASEMALKITKEPLVIAYSGGKDSDVLLALAEMSGIPMMVNHNHTSVDAPETVYHVRETLRRLESGGVPVAIDYHKRPDGTRETMWSLCLRHKMLPTRWTRFCCADLKEESCKGRMIATGVRWAESAKRKNRGMMEIVARRKADHLILMDDNTESRMLFESCQMKGKRIANPIVDWTYRDIWDFIRAEKVQVNPLYAEGWERVGCIGCPMGQYKHRIQEFARYPKYEAQYKRTLHKVRELARARGKLEIEDFDADWQIWLGDDVVPGQTKMEGYDG